MIRLAHIVVAGLAIPLAGVVWTLLPTKQTWSPAALSEGRNYTLALTTGPDLELVPVAQRDGASGGGVGAMRTLSCSSVIALGFADVGIACEKPPKHLAGLPVKERF